MNREPQLTIFFVGYDSRRPSQPYSSFLEYNARRHSQEPMYLQYALSGAADSHLQQPSTAYDWQSDHMDYGTSPVYQPRATFEATPSSYNDYEPGLILQVSSYNPQRGTKGTPIYIYLDSSSDLQSPTPRVLTLMFATRPVPVDLTRLEAREQDICYRYLVSATAPAFSETASSNLWIPLCLRVQEQSRLDADLIEIGPWLYEDGKQLEYRWSPQEVSRKRKVTDEPSGTPRSTKRVTLSEQQTTQSQECGSNPHPSASLAYKQSLHDIIDFNNMERRYTPYGRSQLQQGLQAETNPAGSQDLVGSASTSHSLMRPPVAQLPAWNSSYGAGYQSGRNPQPNATPSFQVSSISSPSPVNLGFVRTSKIPAHPDLGTTPSSNGNFNPHKVYPLRALLEICGNLKAMPEDWTAEERAEKRRIVRFWREQDGATLHVYFKPVKADEQALPHETCECRVNCVYWEERNEYYLTSVDTICLLEALVAAKFNTAEKNRIRRNLETFKPDTISSRKPERERFFNLIMGLPNPKPRMISKDVKAFNWIELEGALIKIIGKYVRSISLLEGLFHTDLYQSAVPSYILDQPRSPESSHLGGTRSEAGASRYSALSSRPTSGSTASGAYGHTLKSSTLSPLTASHGLPSYSQQASPLQPFAAPSLSQSYTIPTLGSQYIPSDPSTSPYAAQVSTPSLSSAYAISSIGHHRTSDVPTDDTLVSTSHHLGYPRTSAFLASLYAPHEASEATATLGLPGRASIDLSTDFHPDISVSASMGDGQYRRHPGIKDETETRYFKQE